jgi:uncharacterized protein
MDNPAITAETLYPTDMALKVVGVMQAGFADSVMEIVKKHAPGFDPNSVSMRPSSGNKYLALTVTVRVESREHLEALYKDLGDHPLVKWSL